MNEEDKLTEEQFKKLPPNLQQAIKIVPWKSSVNEISLLHKLSLEQANAVERETMFIIYGFENPVDYIDNLMRETQIDEVKAIDIAEAVNQKIFKVISRKVDELEKQKSPIFTTTLEVPPTNLPMVEKWEVAHSVPHVEEPVVITYAESLNPVTPTSPTAKTEKPIVPIPDYRYPSGKDPYKEPIA